MDHDAFLKLVGDSKVIGLDVDWYADQIEIGAYVPPKPKPSRFGGSRAKRGSRHEIKLFVHEYKRLRCCMYCEENEPRCLHFHHREPSEKKFNLSQATKYTLNQVKAEIEKCDLLCANCHAKVHANRITRLDPVVEQQESSIT